MLDVPNPNPFFSCFFPWRSFPKLSLTQPRPIPWEIPRNSHVLHLFLGRPDLSSQTPHCNSERAKTCETAWRMLHTKRHQNLMIERVSRHRCVTHAFCLGNAHVGEWSFSCEHAQPSNSFLKRLVAPCGVRKIGEEKSASNGGPRR